MILAATTQFCGLVIVQTYVTCKSLAIGAATVAILTLQISLPLQV